MLKLKGTIHWSDLEGGYWSFAAKGKTFRLKGDKSQFKEGQTVEISGEVLTDMMGMGGGEDILAVKALKILNLNE